MMKLLKYDWKRNATPILAAFIILLVAELALTIIGWSDGWDDVVVYVITVMMYAFTAFLAVLMACQTFKSNIKAYSRRLLPLPSLYAVVTPIILLLLVHLVLSLLYIVHDRILSLLFEKDTLLTLASPYLNAGSASAVAAGYVWGLVFTTIVIFFSIAVSQTVEGRSGTFLGIVACLGLFTVVSFIESFISPADDSSQNLGFVNLVMEKAPDGTVTVDVAPFVLSHLGVVLFELAAGAALVYGIVYMMNRKMKL
ncbi:hypothetical protein D3P08_04620 [Paenibacillus nanensis]|uniref:Uncharacterized protein n=1 Tax=Paenibacillus nanensis TaxID=393251 RepID=A0A3A1VIJ4_9BACL|nr:hypothetical protein [Paenibacillus nanensis]RIX59436.1 hypothetical protein D3P08_04620 [Paenibacillus nanensis]